MPPKPMRFLLIEEEAAVAALFKDMLEDLGLPTVVDHVGNGEDALKFLRCEGPYCEAVRPDLVILDLNMPVMDGHEFLAQAKALADYRSIPVLVLTTSENPSDVHRSYDSHASGYIVKPGSYKEYRRVLDTIHAYWQGLVRLPTLAEITPPPPRDDVTPPQNHTQHGDD